MQPGQLRIEQCEVARRIEDEFGTRQALDYLVGEKFLNFLEAAEADADFRAEIPGFVAEITTIFERWQLAEELERARRTEPFDPGLYDEDDDPEDAEMERQDDIRRSARDLLLVELGKLPARMRAVLVLRYWEDLSEAETAALLGCSAGTVKSQAARGLARIRARLATLEGASA